MHCMELDTAIQPWWYRHLVWFSLVGICYFLMFVRNYEFIYNCSFHLFCSRFLFWICIIDTQSPSSKPSSKLPFLLWSNSILCLWLVSVWRMRVSKFAIVLDIVLHVKSCSCLPFHFLCNFSYKPNGIFGTNTGSLNNNINWIPYCVW